MLKASILTSLWVSSLALVLILALGISLGWLLARQEFPAKKLLNSLLLLPLILPPTVLGYYLVLCLGPRGPLGHFLGVSPMFHWSGAVIAATVVALPLMLQNAEAAFKEIPPELEEASACLGKSPCKTFWLVSLPLARRTLLAGAVLSFARALGEFGATLMLAGNIAGETQTMPLAIYEALMAGDDQNAGLLVMILTLISVSVTLLSMYLVKSPKTV